MEKFLRPPTFDVEPSASNSSRLWAHWFKIFTNFLESLNNVEAAGKLRLLINHVSSTVYEYISECSTYDDALKTLKDLYDKPCSEVFARHKLLTCSQKDGESLDQFMHSLKQLCKDCDFKKVDASQNRDDYVRDAFISGISSGFIRQRLLENRTLTLQVAFDQARSLEQAQLQADLYKVPEKANPSYSGNLLNAAHPTQGFENMPKEDLNATHEPNHLEIVNGTFIKKCFFCGGKMHKNRSQCPARDVVCHNCDIKGHFAKVCKKKSAARSASTVTLGAVSPLNATIIDVILKDIDMKALIDTGSSENFINASHVYNNSWQYSSSDLIIAMANTKKICRAEGVLYATLKINDRLYEREKFLLLPNLCCDVILGQKFLSRHNSVEIPFGGQEPTLTVSALAVAAVNPPVLFGNLDARIVPIATKSRRYCKPDQEFITSEIGRLKSDGVIEDSRSPWRAQVLVVSSENHKKRMVVDYSQTINTFTKLDAYPVPNLAELVEKISSNKITYLVQSTSRALTILYLFLRTRKNILLSKPVVSCTNLLEFLSG